MKQNEKDKLGVLDELEDAKIKLSEHPQYYSHLTANKKFRSCYIRRFHIMLIYEIYEDSVVINSVRHDKRYPFQ